jgi:hypothetical protein
MHSTINRQLDDIIEHAALGPVPVKAPDARSVVRRVLRVGDIADELGRVHLIPDDDDHQDSFPDTPAVGKATVEEGDVILVARGARPKVGLAGEDAVGAVVSANLMILRPKQGILLGAVLAWWLDSPQGREALARVNRSSTVGIPSLGVRDVLRLEVPIPRLEVQRGLAELLDAASATALAERLAATKRQELARALAARALFSTEHT